MGRVFLDYLPPPTKRVYICAVCSASGTECQLTSCHEIISKSFQGRNGQAYLFNSVINVSTGPEEEREMLTGVHVVRDIYCISCQSNVGWKYVTAYEESQKYKEGRFIIEKVHMQKDNSWGRAVRVPSVPAAAEG